VSFKKNLVYILIMVLLLSALAVQKFLLPEEKGVPKMTATELIGSRIPMRIGEWSGKDIPLEVNEQFGIFNFNSFFRGYVNPKGHAVFMLLTTALRDRRDIHPPEVCYLASGFTVEKENTICVPIIFEDGRQIDIPMRRVVVARGAQKEMLLYFYNMGQKYYSNFYMHQLAIVFNSMRRSKDVPILIRLSTPVIAGKISERQAEDTIDSFMRALLNDFYKEDN